MTNVTNPGDATTGEDLRRRFARLQDEASALGVLLSDAQLQQFQTFHDEMLDWNQRVNLTGITEWQEVLTKHFLDSLSVSTAIPDMFKLSGAFLDVGTGAGFPGIPLGIVYPGMRGALLDATAKKTAFLRHVVDLLDLSALKVITDRAETLARKPEQRESYDLVFGRGVARMAALAELTLPFARVGGLVIGQKLIDSEDEIAAASGAIRLLGGELKEVIPVALKGLENRVLVVVEKTSPTPDSYPRRPGIPSKRPL